MKTVWVSHMIQSFYKLYLQFASHAKHGNHIIPLGLGEIPIFCFQSHELMQSVELVPKREVSEHGLLLIGSEASSKWIVYLSWAARDQFCPILCAIAC